MPRGEDRLGYYSAQFCQRNNTSQKLPICNDADADADDPADDRADDPADDAADDYDGQEDSPPVLQLKTVIVGKERYFFGESSGYVFQESLDEESSFSCASDDNDKHEEIAIQDKPLLEQAPIAPILKAIFMSGGTELEQEEALLAALQDISQHSFFKSLVADSTSTSTSITSLSDQTTNLPSIERSPIRQSASTAMLNSALHPESPRDPHRIVPAPRDLFPRITRPARRPDNIFPRTPRPTRLQNSVNTEPLERRAFEFKRNGVVRMNASGKAASMAKSRQVKKILDSILDPKLSRPQQILAFHEAMNHPRIQATVKSAGLTSPDDNSVAHFLLLQQKKMIESAGETAKAKGRPTDDRRSFIEANLLACAESPESAPGITKPSKRARIKAFGLKKTTGYRLLKKSKTKRSAVRNDGTSVLWSTVEKRKGYSKVSPELRTKLYDWFLKHPQVIQSPIANDTLLLKDPDDPKNKIRVGKLLLQIPYRELHNDLLSDGPCGLPEARHPTTGVALISDTALRALTPPQVRTMTKRHKTMCGCETCIIMSQMQSSLNSYRSVFLQRLTREASNYPVQSRSQEVARTRALLYKNVVMPNGKPLHEKPKDALLAIQCKPVEGFSIPHFKCVLRTCHDCPKHVLPREEKALAENEWPISFHVYQNAARCTMHGIIVPADSEICAACEAIPEGTKKGKFRRRKQITLLRRDIQTFFDDFYLPMLEKYAYHRPCFILLGKYETGADRKAALKPGDAETHRDYAERLLFEFMNEIMSEHFGNSRSLSMEGSTARFFPAEIAEIYREGLRAIQQEDTETHFHSHFSDGSMQNAATTYCHMEVLILYLKNQSALKEGGYMFDNTDGCAKQYRCATALHLLSMLSVKHNITIDRAVAAPGHGKDLIDGLNAVDKMYLKELMMRTSVAGEANEDRKIKSHSVEEGSAVSIAEEAARLCQIDARAEGAKSNRKHQKREQASTVKQRHYHVRLPDAKLHDALQMKLVGLGSTGKRSGILSHYHLHADPDLGASKIALRLIPCGCNSCEELRRKEWIPGVATEEQPRFLQNRSCKYWPIFEGANDWKIAKLEPSQNCDELNFVAARQEVLLSVTSNMAESISVGGFGAVMTEDESTNGYYVVKWTDTPFTYQEDSDEIPAGDLVCRAEYLNPVGRARLWYTASHDNVLVRLNHAVDGDLKLEVESGTCKLPRTCNIAEARGLGAKRISDLSHERILDEVNRRDALAFEEDFDESDDNDEISEDSESEDDSSESE
jgi:hypothetical protein